MHSKAPDLRNTAPTAVESEIVENSLYLQAGDDEEESGPNVSQVTGPEESAARQHMSPIPTFGEREFPLGRVRAPRHPLKLGGSAHWTPQFS